MVLAYYPDADGDLLILDNLMDDILPAPRRTDLFHTTSFNAEDLWSARRCSQTGRVVRMGRARDGALPGGRP